MSEILEQRPRSLPPVRKRITVPLPPAEAFRLFTDGIDRWWPSATHSLSAGRGERPRKVVVEPREGGSVYEIQPDGSRAAWATVTRWAEGRALALHWHLGRDPSEATRVEVTFTGEGDGTRVDLVHGGWSAQSAPRRDNYRTGWDLVLCQRFAAACRTVMA